MDALKNGSDREEPSTVMNEFFRTPRRALIFVIAIAMALFHLYTAAIRPLPGFQQRAIHIAFALALTFLIFPIGAKPSEIVDSGNEVRPLSFFDLLLAALSFALGVYVFVEYEALSFRVGDPTFLDTTCSFLAVVLVLEATRRVMGWSIVIICFAGFAYLAFGEQLPSFIAHTGFTFERVINDMFLTTEGILGPALAVSATIIVMFIIFGSFLQVSGAGQLFIDMAMTFFGRFRGGGAKAGIVASCLFGMITGSQAANVAAVGVFTIPIMKRSGYRAEVAAAVEAVASTGSMIMPPVMGAAAFIIPEFIGGTYFDVVKAAFIPGFLFYAALYMVVSLQAGKYGLQGLPKSELPRFRKLVSEKGHLILPLLVLIYFLAVQMVSAPRAGFWAIVACVIASQFRRNTRVGLRKTLEALEKGAKGTVIVANACASAGIITGIITITGMSLRFSDALITLSGGSILLLLVLTMIASLILGLPLPPVTCYLVLAVLAAPALVQMGIDPMAAHLFVFFFGTLGNITPPVAPTAYCAAGVAGTDPIKTTNLAFLFSAPVYVIPFIFVYRLGLLLHGSVFSIAVQVLAALIGILCLVIALQGYFLKELKWFVRLLFAAIGLVMLRPHWTSDVIGYCLLALMAFYYFKKVRKPSSLATKGF